MERYLKKILTAGIHGAGRALLPNGHWFAWRQAPRSVPQPVRRILVVALHHIGDVLCATPALRALRRAHPRARILAWVKSRAVDVLRDNPDVDELIVFDDVCTDKTREPPGSWRRKLRFVNELRSQKFDVLVDLSGVFDSVVLGWLSRARYRVGFSSQGMGFLFDREAVISEYDTLSERYNSVVRALGIAVEDRALRFCVSGEDEKKAAALLAQSRIDSHDIVVGIHPGAGWRSKCWFPERFAALADALMGERQMKVILFGGKSDIALVKDIIARMRHAPVGLAGTLTLGEMAAIMKHCRVLIGNDSGPAHIAVALNIPCVVLFGPTNPVYHFAASRSLKILHAKLTCSPTEGMLHCHNRGAYPCRERICLQHISVTDVLDAVHELMNQSHAED